MEIKVLWVLLGLLGSANLLPFSSDLVQDREERPGRIVNGEDAQLGELPYQVSLRYYGSVYCGGALIEPGWVMTAAHCVVNRKASDMSVVLGQLHLSDSASPSFKVAEVHLLDYDTNTKQKDLALLRLDDTASRAKSTPDHPYEPIALLPKDFDLYGSSCVVSGWGHTAYKGSGLSDTLKKAQVVIPPPEKCAEMLKSLPWEEKSMVCAGGADKDACQGDSGGPLACTDRSTGERYIAGVVSWGVGCATEGIPGVYTNIRNYESWVRKTIDKSNRQNREAAKPSGASP